MMTQRFLFGVFMMVGVLALSACTIPREKNRVRPLLEGREWVLEPERFQQLEGDIDLDLIKIIETPNIHNYYYFRALSALHLFPKERVALFLESYLLEKTEPSLLNRALDSFAKAFTTTQPARVETAAVLFLKHPNHNLRLTAARALQQVDRPSAKKKLEDYLQSEPEIWIRHTLQKK